ncbi:hsc70-interacting protein 1-like [Eupeodes corollae]|uniref:hsc70-interacting protein 1-like n=1 Tax=Eupeodes corollae TaxID=290404 RepID=UPI0024916F4D|nr:hsc70-interacting protein 1-like [Eupeodes corollae]
MDLPLSPDDLKKLKTFVDLCSASPQILNMPQLSFVKEFVEKFGGKVPEGEFKFPGACPFSASAPKPDQPKEDETKQYEHVDEDMESESESELELDMDGVIEPDNEPSQAMGDEDKEPTEDEISQASEFRGQAAAAFSEGQFQESIDLYTKAIELNPGNALFHAKRGQAFLKLKKPNACIRDCDRALVLNCDSAAAYKFRGRAHRLLGNWEEAAKDLRQACKLDFDEDADEWLREVTPNAKKIEQHRIKQERKRAEKELKKRQERVRRTQEANEKARDQNKGKGSFGQSGAGGGPGGLNFQDVLSALNDPEIAAALADISGNPANVEKYKNNPKIAKLIDLMKGSGLAGGMPGFPGFPGGFPGSGGSAPGAATAPPQPQASAPKPPFQKPDLVDDGLD